MASTLEVPPQVDGPGDGPHEPTVAPTYGGVKLNTNRNASPLGQEINGNGHTSGAEPAKGPTTEASDADPDKPTSAAEEKDTNLLPADPKDVNAVSEGNALAGNEPGLGSILKGSPFEGEDRKEDAAFSKPLTRSPAAKQKSEPAKPSTTAAGARSQASKAGSAPLPAKKQTTSASPAVQSSKQLKSSPAAKDKPLVNGKPREAPKSCGQERVRPNGPSAIKTQAASSGVSNGERSAIKSPQTPRTPITASSLGEKSPATANPPKPALKSGEPKKSPPQPKKAMNKTSDRLSTAAKAPIAAAKGTASKPATSTSNAAKPKDKASTTPPRGFTKPKPKSPTRPAKLPAAATAPTASSAAKHDAEDGAPAPRAPSRQSNVPDVKKGPAAYLNKPKKTVRASLPANSKPMDKPKSKPRTSMATTAAPSGSFLERMMRPTQSSAQKTHDKVEPASPPSRKVSASHAAKPKRVSEETAPKTEGKGVELKEEPEIDETAEAKAEPMPDTAGRSSVTHADPTSVKANHVAQEMANAEPAADSEGIIGQD